MIIDRLENAEAYVKLHPAFARAFAFLRRPDLAELALEKHPIDGGRLFAILSKAPGKVKTEALLEAHRNYIDIQYVIAGCDEMGYKPLTSCGQIHTPYDGGKDILFFADPPESWIKFPAGSFAIFFPQDAHAPMAGSGEIHKAVVKVAVE